MSSRFVSRLLTGLALSTCLRADIAPDPDGRGIYDTDRPHLGMLVYSNANAVFDAFFEDILGLGDADYNDSAWRLRFDGAGQLAGAEFLFGSSAFTHSLIVGPTVLGQPVRVGIEVSVPIADWVRQPDKMRFWTGEGLENEDLLPHAVVYCREGCGEVVMTPEPGQWAALALGLAGLAYGVARRNRSNP